MPLDERLGLGFQEVGADVKAFFARLAALEEIAFAAERTPVYLIWGQSNAAGYAPDGDLPADLAGAQTDRLLWTGSGFSTITARTQSNFPTAGVGWGPEMRLGQLARTKYQRQVYFIKYADGGMPLTPTSGDTWNPNVTGSLFTGAIAALRSGLQRLRDDGHKPSVRGLIWLQGERDCVLNASQADYAARLTELYNALRDELDAPTLPIIDGLVRSENYTVANVNAAKQQVSTALATTILQAEAFEDIGDNIHYGGAAQQALGRHAYEILERVNYDLPLALPPRLYEIDLSKQSGYRTGGLLLASEARDKSGNGHHHLQPTVAAMPQIIEGAYGKGFGVLRSAPGKYMTGPPNPLSDGVNTSRDTPFTFAGIVTNFVNASSTLGRAIIGGGNNSSLNLLWLANSSFAAMRWNAVTIATSSVATTPTDKQIIIAAYGGAAGNYIRINGVETATSSVVQAHSTTGNLLLFDLSGTNRNIQVDTPYLSLYGSRLTTPQAEIVEGYLAHRFGIPLPAAHPYFAAPPT